MRKSHIKNLKPLKRKINKDLPIASKTELDDFLTKAFNSDIESLKSLPNVIKVGKINKPLFEKLNLKSDEVFFTKKTATHAREIRKQAYNQAVSKDEAVYLQDRLKEAKEAYKDQGDYIIVISEKDDRVNLAVMESDEIGNLVVTLKNIEKNNLRSFEKVEVWEV